MAQRHTAFLDDPRVAECLARSDFQFADLKSSPVSVYLVIPPAKISAYNRLLRGFVGLGIGAMTAGTAKSPWKVAFLLDEFASLGRMQVVEESIAILRGYGVALWLFVQDLSQLQKVYPKADSLLANAAKQFWSTSDLETAKYVSGMLGQKTISYESKSEGTATLASILKGQGGGGGSKNLQHAGRALLLPEEVMRLGGRPIVLIQGERPYLLDRLSYFRDREYQGLAADNPYQAAFVERAEARQVREAPERTPEGRAR
jgi:type IV secretion system protein VirD4